jgi:DNA-binding NtrC family response regulator
VVIPPLRERGEDIPLLLEFFLKAAAQIFRKTTPNYPPELVTLLSSYDFPGNIREMKSLVFDAVARHVAGMLSMERFREVIGSRPAISGQDSLLSQRLNDWLLDSGGRFPKVREVEELLIDEAMKLAKGNQGIAASLLGFTRQTLNKRLKVRKEKTG